MADAQQRTAALLALMPSAFAASVGVQQSERGLIEWQTLRDMALHSALCATGLVSGGAVVTDGTSGSTTALYRIDWPAVEFQIDNIHVRLGVQADHVILGAGLDVDGVWDTAGAAFTAIDTNDMDAKFALCAVLADGSLEYHVVFGAVAGTGAAVAPTAAQIRTSLKAAGITDLEEAVAIVLARGTVARGTDAIVITGVDPASDDGLRGEQVVGMLLAL